MEWYGISRYIQSSSLEQVFIVLGPSLLSIFFRKVCSGLVKPAIFIDGRQLLNHVVVKAVEHDQQDTARGGKSLQTRLRERIGLQLSILVGPNEVLFLLDITIKNRKV